MRNLFAYKTYIRKRLKNELAATLIEYSFVILLLLGLLGALIEISRYMAISGVLNQAAQRAVNLAARLTDLQYEASDAEADYKNFLRSRDMAIDQGLALALGTFLQPSVQGNSGAHLIPFKEIDTLNAEGNIVRGNVDLILLRPSEFVEDVNEQIYSHSTVCPSNPLDPCLNSAPRRAANASMASLLEEQNHPLMALVRARVPSLLGFGEYTIEGRAFAYRTEPRKGIYAKPPPTLPPPPIPPANSATPTWTPNPAHSPTATRTATATPTATIACRCNGSQYRFCRSQNKCPYCPNFANECVCTADLSLCGGGGG